MKHLILFLLLSTSLMAAQYISVDSYHFVGGIGTKSGGAPVGGGCTAAAWASAPDITNFVGANGGVKYTESGCTATDTGSTVTIAVTTDLDAYIDGTLVYVDYAGDNATDGVYEATFGTNTIVYTADAPGTGTVTVYVGGAYATLAAALADDSTLCAVASGGRNRSIYTNKDETSLAKDGANAWSVTVATGGYVNANGTVGYRNIIGFSVQPGDLDYGQPLYKTRQERMIAYGTVTDAAPDAVLYPHLKTRTDAEDCATLRLGAAADYVTIRNLYIGNDEVTANNFALFTETGTRMIAVSNCVFYAGYSVVKTNGTSELYMDDCLMLAGGSFGLDNGASASIMNSIFAGSVNYQVAASNNLIASNCLFYGGTNGFISQAAVNYTFANCVFYGQTTRCIYMFAGVVQQPPILLNCILSPATTTTYCVQYLNSTNNTRLIPLSKCVYYCVQQNAVVQTAYEDDGYAFYVLRQNPNFRNIAQWDFSVTNRTLICGGFYGILTEHLMDSLRTGSSSGGVFGRSGIFGR